MEFSIADKLRNISFILKIGKDLSYDYEECIEKENTAVFKSVGQFIDHNQYYFKLLLSSNVEVNMGALWQLFLEDRKKGAEEHKKFLKWVKDYTKRDNKKAFTNDEIYMELSKFTQKRYIWNDEAFKFYLHLYLCIITAMYSLETIKRSLNIFFDRVIPA